LMSTRPQLEQIYDELAAPSAKVFLQALRARNIQVRAADVRTFLASKSERQIQQPGNRFSGKVVAFSENDRWGTDVISFVANPAVKDGKKYNYVLIVQDFFTRKIWTTPMVALTEVTESFVEIVGDTPVREVVADRGIEYRAVKFQLACKKLNITVSYKNSNDRNGPTSRLDAAIGRLRRSLIRLQELGKGSDWLAVLERATAAYNNSHHESTDAIPNSMSDSIVLEQKKRNAVNAGHNDREIRARKAKLQKLGGFRVLNPKANGIVRKRAGAEIWSRRIHLVSGFPIASRVADEDGEQYDTKQTLAVPTDSSELAVTTKEEDVLRPYAESLRALIPEGERVLAGPVMEQLKVERPGIKALLRNYRLTIKAFVLKFPDLILREGRRISAV